MADPDREQLEQRIQELEDTVAELRDLVSAVVPTPTRREALKLGGTALAAGIAGSQLSGSAAADSHDGQLGTDDRRVRAYLEEVDVSGDVDVAGDVDASTGDFDDLDVAGDVDASGGDFSGDVDVAGDVDASTGDFDDLDVTDGGVFGDGVDITGGVLDAQEGATFGDSVDVQAEGTGYYIDGVERLGDAPGFDDGTILYDEAGNPAIEMLDYARQIISGPSRNLRVYDEEMSAVTLWNFPDSDRAEYMFDASDVVINHYDLVFGGSGIVDPAIVDDETDAIRFDGTGAWTAPEGADFGDDVGVDGTIQGTSGTETDPAVQLGSDGAGFYVDGGEVYVVNEAGETTQLT